MRTVIVGVGNTLMRDDGVGIYVARELMQANLPEGVEAIDAGTSPDAVFLLGSADRVIVIDAARLGGSPGTIHRLTVEEATAAGEGVRSCHDMGLVRSLHVTHVGSEPPEVEILGVEPKEIAWGIGLSDEVAASVPLLVQMLQQELKGAQCS